MGDGIIGKFVYYWIFIIGGFVMGKVFHLTETTANTVMFLISLTIMYIGFMLIRSNAKKKSAAKRAAAIPRQNNRHKKKR